MIVRLTAWQKCVAGEVRDELLRVLGVERVEHDRGRVRLAAAPRGLLVDQLRAGEADEQDRRVLRPLGDVADEVEECALAPVDVLEHEHERALARDLLQQPAAPHARSPPARRACSTRPAAAVDHCSVVLVDGRAQIADRVDDVAERPVRDTFAVREAPPDEHGRLVAGAAASSRASRDFPTPAGPSTVKRWQPCAPIARA